MDACMYVVARNVYRHRFCLVATWIVATLIFTVPALVLVLRRTVAKLQRVPSAAGCRRLCIEHREPRPLLPQAARGWYGQDASGGHTKCGSYGSA